MLCSALLYFTPLHFLNFMNIIFTQLCSTKLNSTSLDFSSLCEYDLCLAKLSFTRLGLTYLYWTLLWNMSGIFALLHFTLSYSTWHDSTSLHYVNMSIIFTVQQLGTYHGFLLLAIPVSNFLSLYENQPC